MIYHELIVVLTGNDAMMATIATMRVMVTRKTMLGSRIYEGSMVIIIAIFIITTMLMRMTRRPML